MAETNELVVVTARFLADGASVYLNAAGSWTRALSEAQPYPAAAGEAEAEARAKNDQRQVADPYTIKVAVNGAVIDPLTTRERIRSTGPTVPIRKAD